MLREENILQGLNEGQKKAAKHINGPALVIATAGSGKTKTLVTRVQYMITQGIDPSKILLTTFTNKAANEMKSRIVKNIGQSGELITVGTIHSICNRILRQHANEIDYNKNFTIIDEADAKKLLKKIGKTYDFKAEDLKRIISNYKSKCITAKQSIANATTDYEKRIADCYEKYQTELKRSMSMDFDDLLLNTYLLLDNNPEVLSQVNKKWQYISADENQDSSDLDSKIFDLLGGKKKNIFFVGDDYQCLTPDTMIKTPDGDKRIDSLNIGDELIVGSGRGETTTAPIDSIIKKEINKKIIKLTTSSGKALTLTPEHILFSRVEPIENKYYVYLMYRKDKGFRIGRTSSVRTRKNQKTNGFEVRLNQERGEKIWILECCDELQQAIYFEQYYSYEYGIPQYRFESEGTALSQVDIDELFNSINTFERGLCLLNDKKLFLDYPHHTPQTTTRFNRESKRIMFNMFGEKRNDSVPKHTINICCKDENFYNISKDILSRGYSKNDYYVCKYVSLEYDKCMELINTLENTIKNKYNYVVDFKARISLEDKNYKFTPARNLLVGSIVCIFDGKNIIEDTIATIEEIEYKGYVYDLNINNYRNYIANNIVVHNCIYGFRNANIEVILNLKKYYPDLKYYNLGVNYRSTKTIIEAGKSIIKHNKYQMEKEVSCGRLDKDGKEVKGPPVIQTKCKSQADEASKIIVYIKQLQKKGVSLKEIAVLYRATYLSRTIEEAFLKNNIKYELVGGIPFFCRMEIQDILSYAKLVVNRHDFQAFKRTISIPKRGIGDKTLDNIDEFIRNYPAKEMNIRDALDSGKLILKGKASKTIKEYNELLKDLDKQKMKLSSMDFIKYIIESIGYVDYLEKNYQDDIEERLENINELLNVCKEYDDIEDLLVQASLYREDKDSNTDAVQLMTVHKSKGLEFEAVIMTNMCEDIFPHYLSLDDPKDIEEERRLAFVGVTRAKNFLFMTYPTKINRQGIPIYAKPSRFLNEIDTSLVYKN